MTKRQRAYYLGRIYRLLEDPNIRIKLRKFRKKTFEGMSYAPDLILLDPREAIIPTLVHESLHLLYWNVRGHPGNQLDKQDGECNNWVKTKEEEIVNGMTDRQWRNLFYRLGNRLSLG